MGIVIPFEVVRRDKAETEEETRIAQKESIYRGLIEQEAMKYGVSFEEVKTRWDEETRILDAKDPDFIEMVARRKGISPYEARLDTDIGFLQSLNKYAPDYREPGRFIN